MRGLRLFPRSALVVAAMIGAAPGGQPAQAQPIPTKVARDLGQSVAPAPSPVIPASAPRPLLVLAVAELPGTDIDERAVAVIAAHLRPLGVELQIVRADGEGTDLPGLRASARKLIDAGAARGVLWVDVARKGELGLYLLLRGGDQLYGRRVSSPAGKPTAALEGLAGIASAAAEEVLEGRASGLAELDVPAPTTAEPAAAEPAATPAIVAPASPDAAPEPTPLLRPYPRPDAASAAPRGPVAWPSLALAAGYVGGTFRSDAPWQNGASLLAAFAPMPGLYLGAGFQAFAPTRLEGRHGQLDLTRHPIFASGGYRLALRPGIDLQLGARTSFDITESSFSRSFASGPGPGPTPSDTGPGPGPGPGQGPHQLRPDADRVDLFVSAAPVAQAMFRLTDWMRLEAMVGADFHITEAALSGATAANQAAPDAVRFIAGLGVEFGMALPTKPKATRAATATTQPPATASARDAQQSLPRDAQQSPPRDAQQSPPR